MAFPGFSFDSLTGGGAFTGSSSATAGGDPSLRSADPIRVSVSTGGLKTLDLVLIAAGAIAAFLILRRLL